MRKSKKRTLTIMLIPDPSKPMKEMHIPKWPFYVIPLVLIGLAVTLFLQQRVYEDSVRYAGMLEQRLSDEQIASRQLLNEKEAMIEQLQDEVLALSEEADQVRGKLEELKELESDLRGLTAAGNAAEKDKPVQIASVPSEISEDHAEVVATTGLGALSSLTRLGIGGTDIPLSDDDILGLADDSKTAFDHLFFEIDDLKNQMQSTRDEVMEYRHLLRITPSIWPTLTTKVTSTFGPRRDPFTRRISSHTGIDIGGSYRESVLATADGKVVGAAYDRWHGYNVVIDHSNGIRTWYMHLSKILAKEGDRVERGDAIGLMGSTGRSTGVHLHYEVLVDGVPVNPKPYMKTVWKDES